MNRLSLLLRALRWRASATLALLAVATAAVLAASAGPFYYTAVSGEVLHTTLATSDANADGLTAVPSPALAGLATRAQELEPLARQYHLQRWYRAPIETLDAGINIPKDAQGYSFNGDLVYRTGVCAHLTFVSGHCPRAAGQVTLTQRSAEVLEAHIGSQVVTRSHGFAAETVVKVVGIVRAGTGAAGYWMGDNFFDYSGLPTSSSGIAGFLHQRAPQVAQQLPQLDAMFTVPATVLPLPLSSEIQFRLRDDSVGVDNVSQLVRAEKRFAYASNTRYIAPATTPLISTLAGVDHQDDLMLAIVVVVSLELVLLTLFVLYGLVSRTVEARQREIALAKLHGFRSLSVLGLGLLEPLVVILAAVPLGILLSWLVMHLISSLVLGGAPVLFSPLVLLAALAAMAGGLVATVLGVVRILRGRLVDELTATDAKPSPVARAALDGMAVMLAVGAVVELRVSGVLSGGTPNPLALFAPALIAVAVGVLGVRLVPLLCGLGMRLTRDGPHLATHLALRQVVRRPANLRQILVMALATGLACFAVVGWAVAAGNRVERADFQVGAAQVLKVRVPSSVDLVEAVRRADPSGRYAMAVEESLTPSQNLLAVDAPRLARVAYWQASVSASSAAQLERWLNPKVVPATVLTGTQARITADLSPDVDPTPDLQFDMVDPGGNATLVDFGYLAPGTHTYEARLPANCVGGCRVTALAPYWGSDPGGPQAVRYSITLSHFQDRQGGAAWHTTYAGFSRPGYWTSPFGQASAHPQPGGQLLTDFSNSATEELVPELVPGELPVTLPGVSTAAAQEPNPVYASAEDFDGTELTLNLSKETVALPRLGEYGFLIDLSVADRAETGPPFLTSDQVWLAPRTPARVVRSLRRQGLKVISVETPGPLLFSYNHGGLAFGYLFFLFAAAAATLLAAGAGVATALMSARGRSFELAVLRAMGVPRRTLLSSLLSEQMLMVTPGVLLGVLAGLLGAALALSSVPQFGSNAGAPPPSTTIPWLPLALTALAMLVFLAGSSALAAAVALRRARYGVLRSDTL